MAWIEPFEAQLRGGVTEGLQLDVTRLVIAGVGVEIHVTGYVEINPGRVANDAIPVKKNVVNLKWPTMPNSHRWSLVCSLF